MSVVAVRVTESGIEIASDSIMIINDTVKTICPDVKLYQSENVVIGTCGDGSECSLMKMYISDTSPVAATEAGIMKFFSGYERYCRGVLNDTEFHTTNSFIIVFQNKAFAFCEFFVREISDFYAIGAGNDYATGALATGVSAEKSVEIACQYSIRCALPVQVIRINKALKSARKSKTS